MMMTPVKQDDEEIIEDIDPAGNYENGGDS